MGISFDESTNPILEGGGTGYSQSNDEFTNAQNNNTVVVQPAIDNEGEVSYDNGISWKPVAECDGYTPGRGFDENSRIQVSCTSLG